MNPLRFYTITNAAAAVAEISIYGPIGAGYAGGISARQFTEDLKRVTAKEITLRIHSPGGSVVEGYAIFNAIQRHPATVTAIVDGIAASMATVVALSASHVKIAANGIWMIHHPNGATEGNAKDLRDLASILEKLAAQILDTYAAKTGKPREEIAALMEAETWMNAEEAKAFGFVDEIIPAKKAAAAIVGDFDLSAFAHPPARPDNPRAAIYAEYVEHMKENRGGEAAAIWREHEAELLAYAGELSAASATPGIADVDTLRAELSARDQAIVSLSSQLTAKDNEIATLKGQALSVDRRASELCASFNSCPPARKDTSVAQRYEDSGGAAIYRQYQNLMDAGKGREAATLWEKHQTSILAYGEQLQNSENK